MRLAHSNKNVGIVLKGLPMAQVVKNLPTVQETRAMPVQSLGLEDPLEQEMATYSSILAWEIPWGEKSDGFWSIGLQRLRCD